MRRGCLGTILTVFLIALVGLLIYLVLNVDEALGEEVTPTPTASESVTSSPSPSESATPSPSPTDTATVSPSPSGSVTPTATATPTPTPSPTETALPKPAAAPQAFSAAVAGAPVISSFTPTSGSMAGDFWVDVYGSNFSTTVRAVIGNAKYFVPDPNLVIVSDTHVRIKMGPNPLGQGQSTALSIANDVSLDTECCINFTNQTLTWSISSTQVGAGAPDATICASSFMENQSTLSWGSGTPFASTSVALSGTAWPGGMYGAGYYDGCQTYNMIGVAPGTYTVSIDDFELCNMFGCQDRARYYENSSFTFTLDNPNIKKVGLYVSPNPFTAGSSASSTVSWALGGVSPSFGGCSSFMGTAIFIKGSSTPINIFTQVFGLGLNQTGNAMAEAQGAPTGKCWATGTFTVAQLQALTSSGALDWTYTGADELGSIADSFFAKDTTVPAMTFTASSQPPEPTIPAVNVGQAFVRGPGGASRGWWRWSSGQSRWLR